MPTGTPDTRLIVIRGNSGSGKTTTAQAIRDAYGRGIALVGQDNIRRVILRDFDQPGRPNIGLIDQTARYALDHDYHVVVEGMLFADRYEDMLRRLRDDHRGRSSYFYMDVTLDQTLRRHATRPMVKEVTPDQLREWYRSRDLLASVPERIIDESSSLQQTVDTIMREADLIDTPV